MGAPPTDARRPATRARVRAPAPSERQLGLDPLLHRKPAQLLEARRLRLDELLVRKVCERRSAPERKSRAERRRAIGRLLPRSTCQEPLELEQIELARPHLQQVSEAPCLQARPARPRMPSEGWRRRPGSPLRPSWAARSARAPPRADRSGRSRSHGGAEPRASRAAAVRRGRGGGHRRTLRAARAPETAWRNGTALQGVLTARWSPPVARSDPLREDCERRS